MAGPAGTVRALAQAAGVAPSTATGHLGRLEAGGVAVSRRDGRERLVRLAVRAYRAGSDLLLMPPTPRAAAHGLVDAIRDGRVDETDVQASVARVDHLLDKLGLVPGPATLPGC